MTITGANSIFMLSVATLFTAPNQLQGYAADDSFTTQAMKTAETMMGVDGILSGGYVNVPVIMDIALQADSVSNALFDQWFQGMQAAQDAYAATATIKLPSISYKFVMANGFLTSYTPLPTVKRLLQPRHHEITWQGFTIQPN